MPLYEYKCRSCEHAFMAMHLIDDRKVPESLPCPQCDKVDVCMQISSPMISYSHKGSMKTTDGFNDRLKDIAKKIPPKYRDNLSNNIR